jgi:hypothetical protein
MSFNPALGVSLSDAVAPVNGVAAKTWRAHDHSPGRLPFVAISIAAMRYRPPLSPVHRSLKYTD